MIKDFNLFHDDYLLENLINESILYYSKDIRRILNRIKDNKIASDLLSVEVTDVKPDITFINLDKEGYLSFITMRNAHKLITDRYPHLDYMDKRPDKTIADELWDLRDSSSGAGIYDKSRNSIAIGKFVNKIFPGKYNDKEREEFVNKFKAAIEGSSIFELVEGNDINHWYWYENYLELKGNLGSSCMRNVKGVFDIYTKNPEVCKLLILKDGDKILGRALVWKLKKIKTYRESFEFPKDLWFMDRQYTINDSDVEKFRTYAKEKGWAFKTNNNHSSFSKITYMDNDHNVDMVVEVNNINYSRYPYMDTFRRFDSENALLYNDDESGSEYEGQYLLDDTSGSYTLIEGGVWSEWNDRMIPEGEAVWSEWANSYLDRYDSIEITYGSRRYSGWYPDNCDDITYDEWNAEYIHVDDAVYSEEYGYYIYEGDAVSVISDVYSDGDISSDDYWMHRSDDSITSLRPVEKSSWYRFLSYEWNNWDNFGYILKSLMTENYEGNLIPNILKRTVYKVTEPGDDSVDLGGVTYLLEEDAIALDWSIDYNSDIIIDIIQYNLDIEEIISKVKERLSIKISKLDSILKGEQTRMEFEDDRDYLEKISDLKRKLLIRFDELDREEWHK